MNTPVKCFKNEFKNGYRGAFLVISGAADEVKQARQNCLGIKKKKSARQHMPLSFLMVETRDIFGVG